VPVRLTNISKSLGLDGVVHLFARGIGARWVNAAVDQPFGRGRFYLCGQPDLSSRGW
jgi:hypothetical protein